jgi:hypothetical protein
LESLNKLENLIQLDLSDCPIAQADGYRSKMFGLFPGLKILDNKDLDGNEFEYSESDIDELEEDDGSSRSDEAEDDEDGFEDVDEEEEEGENGENGEVDEEDEEEEGSAPAKKLKD